VFCDVARESEKNCGESCRRDYHSGGRAVVSTNPGDPAATRTLEPVGNYVIIPRRQHTARRPTVYPITTASPSPPGPLPRDPRTADSQAKDKATPAEVDDVQ